MNIEGMAGYYVERAWGEYWYNFKASKVFIFLTE
jgi:hypothetical protein